MNILIDIGHPVHVHYYRNLAGELTRHGYRVTWTLKDIPIAIILLVLCKSKWVNLHSKQEKSTKNVNPKGFICQGAYDRETLVYS
jgi:predicted glycosyltransferase